MGNKQKEGFEWERDYRILQKNVNDGTLIITKQGTDQQFIGRQIICSDREEAKQIKKLINMKANSSNPFITQLVKCNVQEDKAYCSSEDKIHILFQKPGQTLREQILARKFSNQKISEQEADIILQAGVKGLKSLREMGQSHNNIATSSFFINENRKVVLGDPWITPPTYTSQMNHNVSAYPSPQKILYQNDQVLDFCPYKSDLFSLGVVILEVLNFQHMDVLYEKGFRRLVEARVQQKLNQIQNQQLKKKLSILLSFDPRDRDSIYKFYRRPWGITGSQVKERTFNKLYENTTPMQKFKESQTAQPPYQMSKPSSQNFQKSLYKYLPHEGKVGTIVSPQPYSQSHFNPISVGNSNNRFTAANHIPQPPVFFQPNRTPQETWNYKPNVIENQRFPNSVQNPKGGYYPSQAFSSPAYDLPKNNLGKQIISPSLGNPNKVNFQSGYYNSTFDSKNLQNINVSKPEINFNSHNLSYQTQTQMKPIFDTKSYNNEQKIGVENKQSNLGEQKVQEQIGDISNNTTHNDSSKNIKLNQPVPSIPVFDNQKSQGHLRQEQNSIHHDTSSQSNLEVNSSLRNIKPEDQYIKVYSNNNSEGRLSNKDRQSNRNSEKLIFQQTEYPIPIQQNMNRNKFGKQSLNSGSQEEESTLINNANKMSISDNSDKTMLDTIVRQSQPKPSNLTPERRPARNYNSTIKEEPQSELSNSKEQQVAQPNNSAEYVEEEYEAGIYKGQKMNGMRNGLGKLLYRQGSMYEGQWKNNMMHGKGKLYYSSGNVAYDGQWNEDEFHGQGKVFNQEEIKLEGPFNYKDMTDMNDYWISYQGQLDSDRRHGKGKLKFSNGQIFVGNFVNDMADGEGKFYTLKGNIIHGVWSDNILKNEL